MRTTWRAPTARRVPSTKGSGNRIAPRTRAQLARRTAAGPGVTPQLLFGNDRNGTVRKTTTAAPRSRLVGLHHRSQPRAQRRFDRRPACLGQPCSTIWARSTRPCSIRGSIARWPHTSSRPRSTRAPSSTRTATRSRPAVPAAPAARAVAEAASSRRFASATRAIFPQRSRRACRIRLRWRRRQ